MKELIWLQSLQHLCLGQNPRITDKSSLFLSGLAKLRTLNLTGTQLTNNGILPLRALTVKRPTGFVSSLMHTLHNCLPVLISNAWIHQAPLLNKCWPRGPSQRPFPPSDVTAVLMAGVACGCFRFCYAP